MEISVQPVDGARARFRLVGIVAIRNGRRIIRSSCLPLVARTPVGPGVRKFSQTKTLGNLHIFLMRYTYISDTYGSHSQRIK
jgi:hypothetical protein